MTIPDFYHNTHAVYMMMVDYAPVYADGFSSAVSHIYPSCRWPCRSPTAGRSHLPRPRANCASIAAFSKDADSYRDMQRTSGD
jgi:hypothetical protein